MQNVNNGNSSFQKEHNMQGDQKNISSRGYPPAFKNYITRYFDKCRTDIEEKGIKALKSNTLWTTDWDNEPMPLSHAASEKPRNIIHSRRQSRSHAASEKPRNIIHSRRQSRSRSILYSRSRSRSRSLPKAFRMRRRSRSHSRSHAASEKPRKFVRSRRQSRSHSRSHAAPEKPKKVICSRRQSRNWSSRKGQRSDPYWKDRFDDKQMKRFGNEYREENWQDRPIHQGAIIYQNDRFLLKQERQSYNYKISNPASRLITYKVTDSKKKKYARSDCSESQLSSDFDSQSVIPNKSKFKSGGMLTYGDLSDVRPSEIRVEKWIDSINNLYRR